MATTESEMIVPDQIEPVVAWRSWNLGRSGNEPRLQSVNQGHSWQPHQAMVAQCNIVQSIRMQLRGCGYEEKDITKVASEGGWDAYGTLSNHDAQTVPLETCQCGLYAGTEFTQAYQYADGQCALVGEVNMWGKVLIGTGGYRAEKAYPKRLFLTYDPHDDEQLTWVLTMADALAKTYGVPAMAVTLSDLRDVAGVEKDRDLFGTKPAHRPTITLGPTTIAGTPGSYWVSTTGMLTVATGRSIAITGSGGGQVAPVPEPDEDDYEDPTDAWEFWNEPTPWRLRCRRYWNAIRNKS